MCFFAHTCWAYILYVVAEICVLLLYNEYIAWLRRIFLIQLRGEVDQFEDILEKVSTARQNYSRYDYCYS